MQKIQQTQLYREIQKIQFFYDISRNCGGNIIIFRFFKTTKGTYCLCQVSSVWHSPIRNKVGVGGVAGGVGG